MNVAGGSRVQSRRQSVEFRDSSPLGQRDESGEIAYFVYLQPMNISPFLYKN